MKSILLIFALAVLLGGCKKNITETKEVPHADHLPGEVIKLQKDGTTMYVEHQNGQYILDGDIILTQEQVNSFQPSPNARAVTGDLVRLWPGGVIPYTFNANVTTAGQNLALNAMWEWQGSGVTFVQRTGQADYIEFNGSTGNNSPIGRAGGKQTLNFVQTASFHSSVAHELGHAMGLFHEQSRADRDNFINVHWTNIKLGVMHNFQTYIARGMSGIDLGTFDFASIMLYESVITDPDFVYNTSNPVLTRLDGTQWGFNFWPSAGDFQSVDYLYNPITAHATWEFTDYSTDPWVDDYSSTMSVSFFRNGSPVTLQERVRINYRVDENVHGSGPGGYQTSIVLEPGQHAYNVATVYSGCRYDGSMNPVPGCRWSSTAILPGVGYIATW